MSEKMPFEGKGRREFGLKDLEEDLGDYESILKRKIGRSSLLKIYEL